MDEKMKYYWVSYTAVAKDKGLGFGNSYLKTKSEFFYAPEIQAFLAVQIGAASVTVLFFQEKTAEEYDRALARDASMLERNLGAG